MPHVSLPVCEAPVSFFSKHLEAFLLLNAEGFICMWCLARADSIRRVKHMGRALGQGEERRGSINSRAQSPLTSLIYRGQDIYGSHSFISFITSSEVNFELGLHSGLRYRDE